MGVHVRVNEAGEIQPTESRSKTLLGHAIALARALQPGLDGQRAYPACDPRSFVASAPETVATAAIERVRDRADAKDVEVILRCACAQVWVQPHAFSEAIYELLDNAVRATRRFHPVLLEVQDTGEGDVLWQIQDSGEGIPERVLAELGQSPGLGVALAWTVIEQHGGLMRFESVPGMGTTASVWLPGRA